MDILQKMARYYEGSTKGLRRDDLRFCNFITKNPDRYEDFVRLARQMVRAGRDHYRARAIVQAMRWRLDLKYLDADSHYKLNDHYGSRFAHLAEAMGDVPKGFFRFRSRHAKQKAREFTLEAVAHAGLI